MKKKKYKLKDERNQEAVKVITGYDFDFYNNKVSIESDDIYFPVEQGTYCYKILNDLGLIDLWFEEVKKEFNVGDYVVLTSNKSTDDNMYFSNDKKLRVGDVYKILRMEPSVYPFKKWILVTNNYGGGISQNQFIHATEEEIKKYEHKIKLPVINSYAPSITESNINYGCVELNREALKAILDSVNIVSVTIVENDDVIVVNSTEMDEIYSFLDKNN